MDDRTTRRLLTIGQLSELTGVPVRTIRFYSDARFAGAVLIAPAARSTAGYRLYDLEAAARLELVRTLRELDIDLPTIARVLARELSVAEVARTHADALEATLRVIRLRQAVLRAVAARDCDWMEMELMHRLAKLDAAERRRILDGYLDRVFEGLDEEFSGRGVFERTMREAFPDLPEEPTAAQVDAWVELVSLVQDESFVTRSREMAVHGARKRAKLSDEKWERMQAAYSTILVPEAEKAYADALAPDSAEGRERVESIITRWAEAIDLHDVATGRRELLESMEAYLDRRINRFWELVAAVAGKPDLASQGAPSFESMEWLLKALRTVG